MKNYFIITLLLIASLNDIRSQVDNKISTLDFVQILDNNREEAVYYYQNNWKILREKAIREGFIHSYELLETHPSEAEPFDFILITTYKDQQQYEKREENFDKLIGEIGQRKLLNDKQPSEFRKNLFFKENVRHWKLE